jgi:hypothetical protein
MFSGTVVGETLIQNIIKFLDPNLIAAPVLLPSHKFSVPLCLRASWQQFKSTCTCWGGVKRLENYIKIGAQVIRKKNHT